MREAGQEMTSKLEKDMIELARGLLADVSGKITPALAAEKSPAKCEEIITAAFIEALAGLGTAWRAAWRLQ
jgi:hypothetical protein